VMTMRLDNGSTYSLMTMGIANVTEGYVNACLCHWKFSINDGVHVHGGKGWHSSGDLYRGSWYVAGLWWPHMLSLW